MRIATFRNWPSLRARRQLPHLGLGIETITGLDLDGGCALADQRIEPRQRACNQLGLGRLACCGNRRDDAAAGARDLLIARALQAKLELMRAIAAEHEMGVAIDQAGRDPAAAAIDPLDGVRVHRKIRLRTRINDAAVARRDQPALDLAEIGAVAAHRGEPGVVPDPVEALCHARRPLEVGCLTYMSRHIIVSRFCPAGVENDTTAFRIRAAALGLGQ